MVDVLQKDVLQKIAKPRTASDTDLASDTVVLPPIKRLREKRPVEDPQVTRESQGRRLAEARLRKGYRTASDAARLFGIAGPTYLAHENGTRQIRPDMAGFYARMLAVSADWILYGDGAMSRDGSETNSAATRRVEFDSPTGVGRTRWAWSFAARPAGIANRRRLIYKVRWRIRPAWTTPTSEPY